MGDVPSVFVVVSGLPASGKSTVARRVAPLVSLPVLDKDDYLESLFTDDAVGVDERQRLSRLADEALQQAAAASDGAILVSWWRRPGSTGPSGTPTEWLTELGPLVELYCRCPPEVAAQRFLGRVRHSGHGDADRGDLGAVTERFARLAEAGPLEIGPVIDVDTSIEVDPLRVARSLAAIA